MSLTVSLTTLIATEHSGLERYRDRAAERQSWQKTKELLVETDALSDDAIEHLGHVAASQRDNRVARAVESILQARHGNFTKPVPNFKAFEATLRAFLKHEIRDGWVYVKGPDGEIYPELVTSIRYVEPDHGGSPAYVELATTCYGLSHDGMRGERNIALTRNRHAFHAGNVVRKRVAEALAAHGIFRETQALRSDYDQAMERHRKEVAPGFTEQYRLTGRVYGSEDWRARGNEVADRRVVHDLDSESYGPVASHAESELLESPGDVPEHPLVRVFDLRSHDFVWVSSSALTRYEYDASLRDKLILPKSHRDLLDVLTTNLDAFTGDLIEGKSAGNVILAKGPPGVGKTLTAEVYAELIQRPLYAIHSGSLGTKPAQIQEALQVIFQRSKRWGCALLLDESDVFVLRRNNSIEQNAVVAEFLRTLEYFDGLLFMTTNRPDHIDEAIISRCAAIIDYAPPGRDDAARIWTVMATHQGVELQPDLRAELLNTFPTIAPRDIKMLLRLALRVSQAETSQLDIEVFRRCAMFRAVEIAA